tara:strand:+ start:687 stop:1361 length:675 start_codon:yes stop_codon:yes gene_type:complete
LRVAEKQMKQLIVIFCVVFFGISLKGIEAKPPKLNEEYLVIDGKQAESKRKVVVIEFFSYACVHCYYFEPALEQWLRKTSSNMEFRRVPAIFADRMIPLAKLYYTLEEMEKLDVFHNLVFQKIHDEKVKIYSKKAIMKWAKDEPELDYSSFVEVFDSFSVGKKTREAKQLTRKYKIPGTPYVTVGGKFLTGPSLIFESNQQNDAQGNTARLFEVIEELIVMIKK